jgi:hypothetical protein
MIDGNEAALNTYMREQDKAEVNFNAFIDSADDKLCEIRDLIDELQKEARDYNGYDFKNELDEMVKDLV